MFIKLFKFKSQKSRFRKKSRKEIKKEESELQRAIQAQRILEV